MKSFIIVVFAIIALGSIALYSYKVIKRNNTDEVEQREPTIWGVSPTCFLIIILCSLLGLLFIASFPYQDSIKVKTEMDTRQDQIIDSLFHRLNEDKREIRELKEQQNIILQFMLFSGEKVIKKRTSNGLGAKSMKDYRVYKDTCNVLINFYNHNVMSEKHN